MLYFTFLGTGSYKVADYFFEDKELSIQSQFVQEPIMERFKDNIDKVFVFCTEESKNCHGKELEEKIMNYKKEVQFIEMNYNVSVEELIGIMTRYINDDYIMDVTHCFRNIPMTVLLIINYLEFTSGYKLKHLYYGNFNDNNRIGKIIDLISQYQQSVLINELQLFNKSLKVSSESIEIYGNQPEITKLIKSFNNFNHMIEYCEFDKSLDCVREIYDNGQSIIKKSQQYFLIVPYLQKINQTMKRINQPIRKFRKKIELIHVLLEYDLIQIAITFTDQLIRQELIHYCYFGDYADYNDSLLEAIKFGKNKTSTSKVYDLSQDLIFYLDIRKKDDRKINYYYERIRESYFDLKKDTQPLLRGNVDYFYAKIRNVVNHGGNMSQDINVKECIHKCLKDLIDFVEG